jgi:hypothetical protein
MKNMRSILAIFIFLLLLTACAPEVASAPVILKAVPTHTSSPLTSTFTVQSLPSLPTNTITPTITSTITPVPNYSVLRGIVNQPHVNCYYGPSKAYLYKYGLLGGNRLDIIGYMADTGYLEVQAIGGDNPCWMNGLFMDVQGDIQKVKPVDPLTIRIPWSPYYPALAFAKANRSGEVVTITWSPMELRLGDDSEQEPYLLETWVCREGRLTFVPIGAYKNEATVIDEAGCNAPSFGRVYGVEKHGYTKYLKFQWPQAEGHSE